MGLAAASGHFRSVMYHSFVLREAGWAPQKGQPEHFLSKEFGVTADPPRAGDRTLSITGGQMPMETPSQRDPAAAHEERGVVVNAGSVPIKFGE